MAKNEEELKNQISKNEKFKEAKDEAHRSYSSEEMQPVIKKADSENAKAEKKS